MRLFLVGCILLLLLAGCDFPSGPAPTPVPSPTAVLIPSPTAVPVVPTPTLNGLTLMGGGDKDTEPFRLDGGNYKVAWLVNNAQAECFLTGALRSGADPQFDRELFRTTAVSAARSSALVDNIPAGQYYLHVQSQCDGWAIHLEPQP